MNTNKLTRIALLAAICVVGRLTFQFIPNIQPVTAIIIITASIMGIFPAICLAIITTYITNLFLGMGIWTIWQMIAWSVVGIIAALIGKLAMKHPFSWLIVFAFISAFLYGLIVNIGTFTFAGNFLAYYLAGLSFDFAHAVGNVIFMAILYPVLTKVFKNH
ncbi:ECF transporter S component [Gracilibacillus sp. S3-1-1]|uniref:ECF transporter S component n=1 Tax=Gracilibacillus pellucidus TaxID=3095368 RepID=A0ACC6M5C4_9BACI|nr:ECF transporter S component [Gracilibacillus sp. S3-1-1]MDX8046091.1 ECF transporter S component [Gracilibacillus sp. S3-1-1]